MISIAAARKEKPISCTTKALVVPLLVAHDLLERIIVANGRRWRVGSVAVIREGCVNQQSAAPLGARYPAPASTGCPDPVDENG